MTEEEQYYTTTRENLLRAIRDPLAVNNTLENLNGHKVEHVLDVGCGIGQALFHLAVPARAEGIGVDVSALGLRMGRAFYEDYLPNERISFVRAGAESLPFESESFDVVNCSLALPYTHNARAIAEVARVLQPGGIFLLKSHHARFYVRELWHGLTKINFPSLVHGSRVLAAGTLYHLFRRQPQVRFLNETYQTRWLLNRELTKYGLVIEREQKNTNLLTPAFVIRKHSE